MHRRVIVWIILMMVAFPAMSQVQVRARADKESILIGQPFDYTIEAYIPPDAKVQWPETDTIPGFEILSVREADSTDKMDVRKIVQHFILTGYDTGRMAIPPVSILVDNTPWFTDSVWVQVNYAPFNPEEDYRDIRTIMELPHPFAAYLPYIIGAAAVISLSIGIRLLFRKKTGNQEADVEEIPLTALQKAIRKLEALQHHPGEPLKYYYASMNEILKEYLHEAFDIHAMDKTNSEILQSIRQVTDDHPDLIKSVRKALEISDYVKFAKFLPDAATNEENKSIIITTITRLDKQKLR